MVEWGILAVLVMVFLGVFGHYARRIQGQSERAAVLSTLGALRTALVIDHVQRAAKHASTEPSRTPSNPFLVLNTAPVNYAGEMSVVQSLAAPPGRWVYDPQCVCIGYLPMDSDWHSTMPDASILWFKVTEGQGPRELIAMAPYTWQGLAMR